MITEKVVENIYENYANWNYTTSNAEEWFQQTRKAFSPQDLAQELDRFYNLPREQKINEISEFISGMNITDETCEDLTNTITTKIDSAIMSVAASALGRKGGKSKSPAKQQAARENGKLGGRPRKIAS